MIYNHYDKLTALISYMATDLNSLANNTTNIGATVLDNSDIAHFYGTAELVLASVDLSGQTNPSVELYMVPTIDGTNYVDDGTDASTTDYPPSTLLAGVFAIQATSAAHRACIELFQIGPFKYTPVLINKTGAAFASSGNTLKIATLS